MARNGENPMSVPPIGERPKITTTPIQLGTPGATPITRPTVPTPPRKVERYNVESYQCLQEDTWASISKKKYLTERYAEALQAFNMQNPQTSDRLKRDGRPAPGDDILVPPAWLLSDRHGSLIRREDVPSTPAAPR